MACEHAFVSTTGCARGCSLWNKIFVKGACSRLSCTPSSSRQLQTWPPSISSRKVHHGRFGTPEEEKRGEGKGGKGEATAGESVLATPLWGMRYVDDAEVVSQSPEQLRKMIGGIVVVCAALSLTVSEVKTEIMCFRAKKMPDFTAIFSVEAAAQVYNQTNDFVFLEGNANHNVDLSIEVDRRIRNAWCSFRKYNVELYDRPSAPLELKILTLRADVVETMLYGCVTWSPRACHHDTLRRVHHRFLTRCIGW